MSQPTPAPTVIPIPDATIMKRLGYIRLLHQQAVTQSYAPAPLNFSSLLAFHDVMEDFFIVAVAHLGNKEGIDLKAPFVENVKKLRAPDGNRLFSLDAVRRVGHDRNGYKHNGSIPGPDQIEQARRDATTFLEGNCTRLFGIDFSDVSVLHIVPQDAVRNHLSAGRAAADSDDLQTAMAEVALGFDRLIVDWGQGKTVPSSSFLAEALNLGARGHYRSRRIEVFPNPSDQHIRSATASLASSVEKAFEGIDRQLETIRNVLRIQIAGADMADYTRFATIAPEISVSLGGKRTALHKAGQLHYTLENYNRCERFVVESALRIARGDFKLWMPRTMGDWERAKAAMDANGGLLPEDMQDE